MFLPYIRTLYLQIYFLNRTNRILPCGEELTRHIHPFYISSLRRPFLTGLGCPIACLIQHCLNSLGLVDHAPIHPTNRCVKNLWRFLRRLRVKDLTITSV